jgi:hypothetical protein
VSVFDSIVIPGGGIREGGQVTPWAAARFDCALQRDCGQLFVCLSAGTTHRPPPLEGGFPVLESVAGARYLVSRGVKAERIRLESTSYDTIGNGYLTRLMHADPAGWTRMLVITSSFHMPRTKAIFEWVFGMEPRCCQVEFEAVPDAGIDAESLRFREAKERNALEAFEPVRARIRTLAELNRWFFVEHKAYSAAGRTVPRPLTAEGLLAESY